MMLDRPLPRDDAAERAVIGAVLLDPVIAYDAVSELLGSGAVFFSAVHTSVWGAVSAIAEDRGAEAVDLVTVSAELQASGHLDQAGGTGYLAQLLGAVPTAVNAAHYAGIVADLARRRAAIAAAAVLADRAYNTSHPMTETIAEAQAALDMDTEAGAMVLAGAAIEDVFESIRSRVDGESAESEVVTGLADVDRTLSAMQAGDLVIIAARPAVGKSAFALNIVERTETPTVLFSLEMSTPSIVLRLLAMIAQVDAGKLSRGCLTPGEWQAVTDAAGVVRGLRLWIDDTGALPITTLCTRARTAVRRYGARLVIVDYLQLVRHELGRGRTRENEVSEVSRRLKALAKELSVPVLALCQLNRQADGTRPRMSHLRESGSIEQDADIVALLHRDEEEDPHTATLDIAKHRSGPTGVGRMTWRPECMRFENHAGAPEWLPRHKEGDAFCGD